MMRQNAMPAVIEQPPSRRWMIMLADLVSLMLTFFVLIYSMTDIPTAAWREVVVSLRGRLNPEKPIEQMIHAADLSLRTRQVVTAANLDYLAEVLSDKLAATGDDSISLRREQERLVLSLPGDLYFQPGEARPQAERVEALVRLGEILRDIRNPIQVEGHTDPAPLSSEAYLSNWELSLARAGAVADLIAGAGYANPIRRVGRADGAFHEISQDLPQEERYKKSRRVDIVIRP